MQSKRKKQIKTRQEELIELLLVELRKLDGDELENLLIAFQKKIGKLVDIMTTYMDYEP